MTKPFDATLNRMIEACPDDWVRHFAILTGIPPGPGVAVDTDLATTLQADKIFRIDGPAPSLLHLEFQASSRLGIPPELMRYNVHVGHHNGLPVQTVLVLLRPSAQASDMDGVFRQHGVNGKLIHEFHYHVGRVWQRPVSFWLDAGPGLASLSLLTDEAAENFEQSVVYFRDHLKSNIANDRAIGELWSSSFVLCGLRHDPVQVSETFRRLSMLLEESTTYQAILQKGVSMGVVQGKAEGKAEGERNVLLRQGTAKYGPPSEKVTREIHSITDMERLTRMTYTILDAKSWEELLGTK